VDLRLLASLVPEPLAASITDANTALHALELAQAAGVPIGDLVAARARQVALGVLAGAEIAVDVVVIDRSGTIVGRA
jgi:cobalt-precorrin-5B (C1)-methyltransferase